MQPEKDQKNMLAFRVMCFGAMESTAAPFLRVAGGEARRTRGGCTEINILPCLAAWVTVAALP